MRHAAAGANGAQKRAFDEQFSQLYMNIRSLASRVRWKGSNPTMNATALVHEAYLKLLGNPPDLSSKSSEETIAIFANAMRQILVDAARRKSAQKRAYASSPAYPALRVEDGLTLKAVLEQLERDNPRQSRIVNCRFYLGMTVDETAAALDVSSATVTREWREAKTRLGKTIGVATRREVLEASASNAENAKFV